LADRPVGALTPAQAFGADFALSIEGTRRYADQKEKADATPEPER